MDQQDLGLEAPQPGADTPEQAVTPEQGADVTGASDNSPAETEEQRQQREASEAARTLNERRTNKQNAERRLQEDRDAWRDFARQLAQGQNPRQPDVPRPEAPREPTLEFDPTTGKPYASYEKFIEDRAAFIAESRAQAIITGRLQQALHASQQQRAAQEAQEVDRQHVARNREFARQVPDFDEVTDQDIPIPGYAVEAIKRLQNGPAVMYVLGKNPELAYDLNQRGPVEQVVMVGQLSSWIAANTQRQVSQSAPAGRGVGGRPAPADTPPEDTEEYFKWANKRFGKR